MGLKQELRNEMMAIQPTQMDAIVVVRLLKLDGYVFWDLLQLVIGALSVLMGMSKIVQQIRNTVLQDEATVLKQVPKNVMMAIQLTQMDAIVVVHRLKQAGFVWEEAQQHLTLALCAQLVFIKIILLTRNTVFQIEEIHLKQASKNETTVTQLTETVAIAAEHRLKQVGYE
jgi:hypothetical protein